MVSSSDTSNSDPPGFLSQTRLLRTPFRRMLQQLNLRPSTPPESIESSEIGDVLSTADHRQYETADPPPSRQYLPQVTESVGVAPTSLSPPDRHRPDPEASFSSSHDPLSAYSPYSREVILGGGDQSVHRSYGSLVDTVEAAEEALYDADISPGGESSPWSGPV